MGSASSDDVKLPSGFEGVEAHVTSVKLPDGTWDAETHFKRGNIIDEVMGNNTGHNYPKIGIFDGETGTAASVKSLDTSGRGTYGDGISFYSATYSMRDGFRGFLASYVAAETAAAFYANAPLSEVDQLLTSTAQGLLTRGSSFEITRYGAAACEHADWFKDSFKPDIKVEYNKTEMVKDGDGNDHEFTYTEVTYGNQVGQGPAQNSSGGFIAMTNTDNLNAAYSDMRDILAGRKYENLVTTGFKAAGKEVVTAVVGELVDKAAKSYPAVGVVYKVGSSAYSVYQAVDEQSAVNSSINTTFNLDAQDRLAHDCFYESGTFVADSEGNNAQIVAPGFANNTDRENFTAAYSQYRYDNTNGRGATYDSYLDWAKAEAELEGGYTASPDWPGPTVHNYHVASHRDELVWKNPAPANR